ncbi:hypothetical protein DL771_001720 [Monosporascus sp. 5C6A]|nr:hypothetical protein DL771_001720 [Monosporascus sp. 5C6A]
MMTINLDCVATDRGGTIDNRDYVHLAVVARARADESRLRRGGAVSDSVDRAWVMADYAYGYRPQLLGEARRDARRCANHRGGSDRQLPPPRASHADGCYGVGIRESEKTMRLGTQGAVGISVKVEEGSIEILYAVAIEVLTRLRIGTLDPRKKLSRFHHLKRLDAMGVTTGRVCLDIKVRPNRSLAASKMLRLQDRKGDPNVWARTGKPRFD